MVAIKFRPVIMSKSVIICKRYVKLFSELCFYCTQRVSRGCGTGSVCSCLKRVVKVNRQKDCGTRFLRLLVELCVENRKCASFSPGETGNGGRLPYSITIPFTVLIFLTVKSENNFTVVTSCF